MMTAPGFAVFDTAIGRCAVAWSPRGILALEHPHKREADTRAALLAACPAAEESAMPPAIAEAAATIAAVLGGATEDLATLPLDLEPLPPFHRRVFAAARTLPPGSTISYGELAACAGSPGAARAVGQAMRRNPFGILVPCHRVIAAGQRLGGWSGTGGIAEKLRLLARETEAHPETPAAGVALPFDLGEAVAHLKSADAALARLIDRIGPCTFTLDRTSSLFAALTEAIVYQQLHGKAAATIHARLCALYPRAHEGPSAAQILRTSEARLRAAGLSRNKYLALRDLAERASRGEIPSLTEVGSMTDDAIIERLTEVRGIGRWTVEMLLIFRLGRADVFPLDDFGIRQGFAVAFRPRTPPDRKALEKRAARWRPYRSVASWYLWRAAELKTMER